MQSASSAMPTTDTARITPLRTDVLLGGGRRPTRHGGNRRFRQWAADREERFLLATLGEKDRLCQELVDWVHQQGGRFLMPGPTTEEWQIVTDESILFHKARDTFQRLLQRRSTGLPGGRESTLMSNLGYSSSTLAEKEETNNVGNPTNQAGSKDEPVLLDDSDDDEVEEVSKETSKPSASESEIPNQNINTIPMGQKNGISGEYKDAIAAAENELFPKSSATHQGENGMNKRAKEISKPSASDSQIPNQINQSTLEDQTKVILGEYAIAAAENELFPKSMDIHHQQGQNGIHNKPIKFPQVSINQSAPSSTGDEDDDLLEFRLPGQNDNNTDIVAPSQVPNNNLGQEESLNILGNPLEPVGSTRTPTIATPHTATTATVVTLEAPRNNKRPLDSTTPSESGAVPEAKRRLLQPSTLITTEQESKFHAATEAIRKRHEAVKLANGKWVSKEFVLEQTAKETRGSAVPTKTSRLTEQESKFHQPPIEQAIHAGRQAADAAIEAIKKRKEEAQIQKTKIIESDRKAAIEAIQTWKENATNAGRQAGNATLEAIQEIKMQPPQSKIHRLGIEETLAPTNALLPKARPIPESKIDQPVIEKAIAPTNALPKAQPIPESKFNQPLTEQAMAAGRAAANAAIEAIKANSKKAGEKPSMWIPDAATTPANAAVYNNNNNNEGTHQQYIIHHNDKPFEVSLAASSHATAGQQIIQRKSNPRTDVDAIADGRHAAAAFIESIQKKRQDIQHKYYPPSEVACASHVAETPAVPAPANPLDSEPSDSSGKNHDQHLVSKQKTSAAIVDAISGGPERHAVAIKKEPGEETSNTEETHNKPSEVPSASHVPINPPARANPNPNQNKEPADSSESGGNHDQDLGSKQTASAKANDSNKGGCHEFPIVIEEDPEEEHTNSIEPADPSGKKQDQNLDSQKKPSSERNATSSDKPSLGEDQSTSENNNMLSSDVVSARQNTFDHLLFSWKHSDIEFKCQDDPVTIPAHKVVLERVSPQLKALFQANPQCKTLTSPHPSVVVKQMMIHLYTQRPIDPGILKAHLPHFLVMTKNLFQPTPVFQQVFRKAYQTLNLYNLQQALLRCSANINAAAFNPMKDVCLAFVQNHAVEVLTARHNLVFGTSHPVLWREIVEASLAPPSEYALFCRGNP